MGRRTIVIETRGDICMSDRDNPRSLVEIMNDVLSTVREHYDSEYVYYIEKEYEDIDVIYEWCAKHVPWQRDKIKIAAEGSTATLDGTGDYGHHGGQLQCLQETG